MEYNNYLKFLLFSLLFIHFSSLGKEKTFGEEKTFLPKEIQVITVKAAHINITVTKSHTQSFLIKWKGNLSFHLDAGLLNIESDNFTSDSTWNEKSAKNAITLNISGPAVPLKLFMFSSHISISHWTKSVFLSSFKGTLKGFKNRGSWEVNIKTGHLDILQHQGTLSVKCFRGNQKIAKSSGTFHFHINEGNLKVMQANGDLNFITHKAKIKLTKFKGNLKGFSHSGEIKGIVQAKEVDLFSKEGSLKMSFIGQAPRVRAYTERGKIYAPKYLHKKFSGASTEVLGRIKGPIKQGTVSLASDTGSIYLN